MTVLTCAGSSFIPNINLFSIFLCLCCLLLSSPTQLFINIQTKYLQVRKLDGVGPVDNKPSTD